MGHARPSRQKEGTAWKSKPMVRSVNENDFDRCLAKGFGRSQTTKTAADVSQAFESRNFRDFRSNHRLVGEMSGPGKTAISRAARSLPSSIAYLSPGAAPSRCRATTTDLCLGHGDKER
jgi:hypothetical protein